MLDCSRHTLNSNSNAEVIYWALEWLGIPLV